MGVRQKHSDWSELHSYHRVVLGDIDVNVSVLELGEDSTLLLRPIAQRSHSTRSVLVSLLHTTYLDDGTCGLSLPCTLR